MIERLFIFAKAQVSSFAGGLVDYLVMIVCTELFHVFYPYSVAIGGVVGAFVNFSINKKWTFRSRTLPYRHPLGRQAFRFCLVVINSIILKASGTYFFTAYMGIDYKVSRIMTDLMVSLLVNYTLQRFWVFRRVN